MKNIQVYGEKLPVLYSQKKYSLIFLNSKARIKKMSFLWDVEELTFLIKLRFRS